MKLACPIVEDSFERARKAFFGTGNTKPEVNLSPAEFLEPNGAVEHRVDLGVSPGQLIPEPPKSEVMRRNESPLRLVVSRGRCNTGLQFIRRSSKSQGLSWPGIETQSDRIEFGLRKRRQVGVLWQVLP